jgi:flavin-dependent dehydrogenase
MSGASPTSTNGADANSYDVVILGGGIAGLTLALQLRQSLPGLRLLVADKQPHPVPEAAHKVGESSVEIQAHYLRDVLGLQQHLEEQQLHKFGLRMFFSHDGNTDITQRVEYGQIESAPLPSYQLDRGRLENALGELVTEAGARFLSGCKVVAVELRPGEPCHHVDLQPAGQPPLRVSARWVIDASGRAALLKRQLSLAKPVEHRANAAWFRVATPIDVDQWSDDEAWRQRVIAGERRLSTNHLMGHGYWVWLIPLSSQSTSVGIVADADIHPFEGFNRFERALEWLRQREPQCAEAVAGHRDAVQDFRVMKDYAYSCAQVYSQDRWCLAGEAGVSIDPLYSSGGDLMAIGNGLITDLVAADLRGEDIEDKAAAHNQVYLVLSEIWLVAYHQQYRLMGNPQVMVAKVIWDTIIYWAVPGLLFFHDKFRRLADSPAAFQGLYRAWTLHTRVQEFFREWHEIDNPPESGVFADPYSLLDFIVDLHTGMAAGLPDDELEAQFARNVALLEQVAGQLAGTVIERLGPRRDEPAVRDQLEKWETDPMLAVLIDFAKLENSSNPIDSSWVTLGHRSAEHQAAAS